ncbi:MAG TPA: hypothetical protein VHI13_21465 [Candidatus Kapabacteria bacterium]|nr:hypothetical protein [Candidatus Kapabacteria bacterium]
MNLRLRLVRAASVVALLVMCAHTVHAQLNWSPPCQMATITNNSPCNLQFSINTNPPNIFPPIVLPPGGMIVVPTPPGTVITGVTSWGGNFYPVNPPPPGAGSPCNPTDWWICCVRLGPDPCPQCCCDICFDPINCTITIWPARCPKCRP